MTGACCLIQLASFYESKLFIGDNQSSPVAGVDSLHAAHHRGHGGGGVGQFAASADPSSGADAGFCGEAHRGDLGAAVHRFVDWGRDV